MVSHPLQNIFSSGVSFCSKKMTKNNNTTSHNAPATSSIKGYLQLRCKPNNSRIYEKLQKGKQVFRKLETGIKPKERIGE
jgi:hypothetical protein